ncbi:MAG: signal recognition particle-docking protein FtsY [Anaerolineae bacterium]
MLGFHRNKIDDSVAKTKQSVFGRIAGLFRANEITDETWDELEMLLIQADVGIGTTEKLIASVRQQAADAAAHNPEQVRDILKRNLVGLLLEKRHEYLAGERMLNVVLVVGVNGSGKTTSIAKLARYHKEHGDRVLLAAADTFRAAAIDQLRIWADRVGVDLIAHQPAADPGAVVFDAIRAAQARGANVLIVDTAGRLHTRHNLMQELAKISSIATKQVHRAPHETLLVLDATTGQNALSQAKVFTETAGVTGVVLAKLDSSSKGGMVFAIGRELGLPVLFVATGEQPDDFAAFDPVAFVDALFTDN